MTFLGKILAVVGELLSFSKIFWSFFQNFQTDSYFHNALVLHYKDIVVEDVSWGDEADTDQGALKAHMLEKMRGFLEASKHYR